MNRGLTNALYGLLGGTVAAGGMTVIRVSARRHGLIEKTVPQAIEEWLASRTAVGAIRHPVAHHLIDQALHAGYAATLGTLYGLVVGRRHKNVWSRGAMFGVGTWLFGSWMLLPILGAKPPSWRQRLTENGVDLGAHLAFGWGTALVCSEMHRQSDHGPRSDKRLRAARVG